MLSKEGRRKSSRTESWISPSSEGAVRAGKFKVQHKILSLTAGTVSARFHGIPKPLHHKIYISDLENVENLKILVYTE